MRIARVFVWSGNRRDNRDEILATHIPHHVTYEGTRFTLRTWDVRYAAGAKRLTDATYDEVRD